MIIPTAEHVSKSGAQKSTEQMLFRGLKKIDGRRLPLVEIGGYWLLRFALTIHQDFSWSLFIPQTRLSGFWVFPSENQGLEIIWAG